MSETKSAIEVVKAIGTLSDYLGLEFKDVASRVVFLDQTVADKLNAAFREYRAFREMGIADRARALGLTVEDHGGNISASMTL